MDWIYLTEYKELVEGSSMERKWFCLNHKVNQTNDDLVLICSRHNEMLELFHILREAYLSYRDKSVLF